MQKYSNVVRDQFGNTVSDAVVTVWVAGTSQTVPVTIYANDGSSPISLLTTDAYGRFSFYAANGRLDIKATKSGYADWLHSDFLLEDPTQGNNAGQDSSGALVTATGGTTARTLAAWGGDGQNIKSHESLVVAGDWTPAINAAITAAPSGGFVLIPPGAYTISGEINCSKSIHIVGMGHGFSSCSIIQTSLNSKIFNFTANDCSLRGVTLDYSGTPTAGAQAIYSSGYNNNFSSFKINRCYEGLVLVTGSSQIAKDFQIYSYVNTGVLIQNNGDADISHFILDAVNLTNGANGGIKLLDFCEAAHISHGDILNGVYSMVCDASVYAGAQRPAYCNFDDVFFDSSKSGTLINNSVSLSFVNCWFSAGRSGAGSPGCSLSTTYEIKFTNTKFVNCGSHGLYVSPNAVETSLTNCSAQGNSVTTGAGVSYGVLVDANVNGFNVTGGVFGNNAVFVGSQNWGIVISSGVTNFNIIGAEVIGNVTGGISDNSASASGRIIECNGFSSASSFVPTVGASPWTYTAGHRIETVYITGGTLSNITVGGAGVFSTTEKTVVLHPNEQMTITHTVAPTVRVIRH